MDFDSRYDNKQAQHFNLQELLSKCPIGHSQAVQRQGLAKAEKRQFNPHITVARKASRWSERLPDDTSLDFGHMEVSCVSLFESKAGEYVALGSIPLLRQGHQNKTKGPDEQPCSSKAAQSERLLRDEGPGSNNDPAQVAHINRTCASAIKASDGCSEAGNSSVSLEGAAVLPREEFARSSPSSPSRSQRRGYRQKRRRTDRRGGVSGAKEPTGDEDLNDNDVDGIAVFEMQSKLPD